MMGEESGRSLLGQAAAHLRLGRDPPRQAWPVPSMGREDPRGSSLSGVAALGSPCLRMKTAEPRVWSGWLCELRQPPCSL